MINLVSCNTLSGPIEKSKSAPVVIMLANRWALINFPAY